MTKNKLKHLRRNFLKKLTFTALMPFLLTRNRTLRASDLKGASLNIKKARKIDIHTHISSDADYLKEVMEAWNLKMFTICNEGLKSDRLEAQRTIARVVCKKFPRYYAWCTTFDLNGIQAPEWADRVIQQLQEDFDHEALAVKVWKEVGMQLKDNEGNFLQIDDPVFEPVLDFIMKRNKTLFMHIGDPPEYWLTAGPDGLPDAWYREGNGVWNRLGEFRGEVSYDSLMRARDRILGKYPDLKMVGCHMGNMSYDVDQLTLRLDRFPNYAVETSFTLPSLMGQAREKVSGIENHTASRVNLKQRINGGHTDGRFQKA